MKAEKPQGEDAWQKVRVPSQREWPDSARSDTAFTARFDQREGQRYGTREVQRSYGGHHSQSDGSAQQWWQPNRGVPAAVPENTRIPSGFQNPSSRHSTSSLPGVGTYHSGYTPPASSSDIFHFTEEDLTAAAQVCFRLC